MLLYGNGRPINTNPNKDYRRLVTQCFGFENTSAENTSLCAGCGQNYFLKNDHTLITERGMLMILELLEGLWMI